MRSKPTHVCENSERLFTILTLNLLSANQEAGLRPVSWLAARRSILIAAKEKTEAADQGKMKQIVMPTAVMPEEESRVSCCDCLPWIG